MTDEHAPIDSGGRGDRDVLDQSTRRSLLPPVLPADFKAALEGSGVRLSIVDVDPMAARSSTVRYVFGHARAGDMSTDAGRKSAASRAEGIDGVDAPRRKGGIATRFISDTRYQSGVFFCWAVGRDGERSESFLWTPFVSGEVLDTTIPADVTRPQVSESGREVAPGIVSSQITVSAVAPASESFDRLQLYYEHYHAVGSIVEGESKVHTGQAGGTIQFQFDLAPFRRGIGAITATPGSNVVTVADGKLTMQARGGDFIEALRARAEVDHVVDNETLILTANWSGPPLSALDQFQILPLVRFYFVSVSRGGTRRSDVQNAPYVEVLLDAMMSPPNAPTIDGTALGNENLIEHQQVLGTEIVAYNYYRCAGASTPFTDASRRRLDGVRQDPTALNAQTLIQFRDTSLEPIERERGDVFTYYVTAENARGQQSAPSNGVSLSCRMNGTSDVDPNVPGRITLRNLLYNAFFAGTLNGTVADSDVVQHESNGSDASNYAGRPYGGSGVADGTGRFLGYTLWHSRKSAGAPSLAQFKNGDEVYLPAPTASGEFVDIYSEVGAWDNATARKNKLKKYGLVVLQIQIMRDATVPNGSLEIFLVQSDNGTERGNCPRQYRDNLSVLQYYTGSSAKIVIPGSSILAGAWTRQWAVFKMEPTLGTTRQLRTIFRHVNSTSGGIFIKQPKLEEGEVITGWTGDMGDPSISYPLPTRGIPPVGDSGTQRQPGGELKQV